MGLDRYLVEAVILEGRSVSELACSHRVSRGWIYKLLGRYREGGYPALEPRSRRPKSCSHRAAPEIETEVLRLRRQLSQAGFDAGPQTILHHLQPLVEQPPSAATVWRILKRNQLITPQPQKRPRCSYLRFEAQLPNQTCSATPPPGSSPTAARSRSSTSLTITPDSSSTPPSFPPSRPTTWSRHSSWLRIPTACPPPS
ncbi:MAG: helix-turn-helix domain-containing protein [Actinomycetota bacterium]|nr:helix-turn-helix domain-containing protein [Actinomycetota bacterium]